MGVEHSGVRWRWALDEHGIAWQKRKGERGDAPWSQVHAWVGTHHALALRVRPGPDGPTLRLDQLSHPLDFMSTLRAGLSPHLRDDHAAAALDLLTLYARMHEIGTSKDCPDCGGGLELSEEPELRAFHGSVVVELAGVRRRCCTTCRRGVPIDSDHVGDLGCEVLERLDRDALLAGFALRGRRSTEPWFRLRVLDARAVPPPGEAGELRLLALVYSGILAAIEQG